MNSNSQALYVFFGLIASGKSTLAKLWASQHDCAYYSSDLTRKELASDSIKPASSVYKQGIYSLSFTEKTYAAIFELTENALQEHKPVVLDASFSTIKHRQQATELAANHSAALWFIYCCCAEEETRKRLAKRALDPKAESDGTWQIYQKQKKVFCSAEELGNNLITLSTNASPEILVKRLKERIDQQETNNQSAL